jgi:hypothetical protein
MISITSSVSPRPLKPANNTRREGIYIIDIESIVPLHAKGNHLVNFVSLRILSDDTKRLVGTTSVARHQR